MKDKDSQIEKSSGDVIDLTNDDEKMDGNNEKQPPPPPQTTTKSAKSMEVEGWTKPDSSKTTFKCRYCAWTEFDNPDQIFDHGMEVHVTYYKL